MGDIQIQKIGITKLNVDAVVNAANSGLWEGSGVCGAIFRDAGSRELTEACSQYGHCDVGSAVITPGFRLKAKYIIHAVGPRWIDGNHGEPAQLYDAYKTSLELAKENDCHSIGFPLISAGIFGYPKHKAWRKAFQACFTFMRKNSDYDIDIVFAVLDDSILTLGKKTYAEVLREEEEKDQGYHAGGAYPSDQYFYTGVSTAEQNETSNVKSIPYNKLVRDRIPEIIEAAGKRCTVETLTDEAYLDKLHAKLAEELNEYLQDNSLEELADLMEVIYATATALGHSPAELEQVRAEKAEKRGGFEKKLLLTEVREEEA